VIAPHLIWAGVVLLLGALALRAAQWRWQQLEACHLNASNAAATATATHQQLREHEQAFNGAMGSVADRLDALGHKLRELDALVRPGTVVKPVPTRRV